MRGNRHGRYLSQLQAKDQPLKKAHRHGSGNTAQPEILAERGLDALQRERFKEAIELFKQAIRVEPRPDWKERLADAYRGRARDLAAKGMFKEASMVLENTIVADGVIRDPELYLSCLIRDGQQQKAAAYLFNHPPEQEDLEALAAALLVSVPQLPDLAPSATPEQRRWRDLAIASRAALAAGWDGAPAAEINHHLNAISLRSAFRPLRLLLKTLISPREDADQTRRVLDTIPPGSPFYPLRQAVAAAVLRDEALEADTWNRLTPRQQTFVAETAGLPPGASQFLARMAEAERGGPGALFNFLLKQADLPQADVRNACINLLPRLPDRVSQFERSFGALSPVERNRIQALAAEERGDWEAAVRGWSATAAAIARDAIVHRGSDRESHLARGVIYRHLADIARKNPQIEANDGFDDPVVAHLKRACEADPDHLPSRLDLIGRYCEDASSANDPAVAKDWHQLVEETVKRFPDDARVLQRALDSALARKAYKQAAGFARKVLRINAINPGVRRQMIELQISYARKQMRAQRPDLATKGLAEAAEWERADAPSGPLRIARALVERRAGSADQTDAKLREGVALAGGGVAGWFRARLEADFMKAGGEVGWLQRELARAREILPTADAIMAIVAALGQPEAGDNKKAVASLLLGLRTWLQQGAAIDWKPSEFQAMAEMLARFEAYDLLRDYAKAARQRDPANSAWRFHEIVGRTQGKADRLSMAEEDELMAITRAAGERQDFHMVTRIGRYLDQDANRRGRGRQGSDWGPPDPDDDMDDEDVMALFAAMLSEMPRATAANLRDLVKDIGREKAIAELVGQMKSSLGREMPLSLLRELCAAMVAQAMGGGGHSRQSNPRPGLPF
jgi:tetratricopeptide (TPR) repeat protein